VGTGTIARLYLGIDAIADFLADDHSLQFDGLVGELGKRQISRLRIGHGRAQRELYVNINFAAGICFGSAAGELVLNRDNPNCRSILRRNQPCIDRESVNIIFRNGILSSLRKYDAIEGKVVVRRRRYEKILSINMTSRFVCKLLLLFFG
jgi:hypothetical protein